VTTREEMGLHKLHDTTMPPIKKTPATITQAIGNGLGLRILNLKSNVTKPV